MYPILARYGPFIIYSYEVVLGLGIGACIGLAAWLTRDNKYLRSRWINGILFASIIAIVGGRIVFVLTQWSYYSEEPGDIWLIWRGGLSYHGLLITGLAALWAWSKWRKLTLREVAGMLAILLALMSVFGWLACWFEGCAFGKETSISLLSGDLPDSFSVYSIRYQTQLMGMILSATVLVVILALRNRLRPLQLFWLTIGLLAASRLTITLFRGDQAPMIGAIRMDTLTDGLMVVAALITLVIITILRLNERPS
ncbi:MAG TPA: prolipoprotein diacylglyceryl transferase family protein [candidate division Zixibacteria bacterium]|nr:prolipoprotein diacylglyceryl transferase family protein [candidate division Zixibacteria bacterium]